MIAIIKKLLLSEMIVRSLKATINSIIHIKMEEEKVLIEDVCTINSYLKYLFII